MASSILNTLWLLVLLSTFATADIDLNARYTVTNSLLGSNTLASTSLNSSLIVTSSASSSDSTWFFTSTSHDSYYRIHTVAKGSSNALDVDNYYGRNSIDMQFYWIDDEKSGQYWQINEQSDGSVKISNNFTGPDMFLGVEEGSLKPVLRAGDGEGSRWTLSSPGSTPTAAGVSSLAAPSATTMSTAVSTSGSGSGSAASSTPTSQVSSTSSSNDKKLSSGAIAGIAVGGVVGLALLAAGAFFLFRRKNDVDSEDELDKPPQMTTDPMINVRGGGS